MAQMNKRSNGLNIFWNSLIFALWEALHNFEDFFYSELKRSKAMKFNELITENYVADVTFANSVLFWHVVVKSDNTYRCKFSYYIIITRIIVHSKICQ